MALKRTYLAVQNILRDQTEKKGIKSGFESSKLDWGKEAKGKSKWLDTWPVNQMIRRLNPAE